MPPAITFASQIIIWIFDFRNPWIKLSRNFLPRTRRMAFVPLIVTHLLTTSEASPQEHEEHEGEHTPEEDPTAEEEPTVPPTTKKVTRKLIPKRTTNKIHLDKIVAKVNTSKIAGRAKAVIKKATTTTVVSVGTTDKEEEETESEGAGVLEGGVTMHGPEGMGGIPDSTLLPGPARKTNAEKTMDKMLDKAKEYGRKLCLADYAWSEGITVDRWLKFMWSIVFLWSLYNAIFYRDVVLTCHSPWNRYSACNGWQLWYNCDGSPLS